MAKKQAFTLAEITIVLVIIGVLVALLVTSLKTGDIWEKSYMAQAYKAMINFDDVSSKIREIESTNVPTRSFIEPVMDGYEFTIINSNGGNASSNDVYNLYKKYIRFTNSSAINFCSNTTYCPGKNIPGGKLPSGAYIGIEVTGIKDCPSYYMPVHKDKKDKELGQIPGKGKCWGLLYVDANGTQAPNTLGRDIFVFGLDAAGVAR